jgi:Anti-sigma-K factor rskA
MMKRKILGALAAVLATGALAGFVVAGLGGGTSTYQADARIAGASAELEVDGDRAILVAEGLPEPEGSYQLWFEHDGVDGPEPSDVLFLPRDGEATVAIPSVEDVEAVLVTREPKDGSDTPSENPVVTIPLT